jgi:hypothetical protein
MTLKKGTLLAAPPYSLIEPRQANICGLVSVQSVLSPSRYTIRPARDFEEEETKSGDKGKEKAGSSKEEEAVIPDSALEPEVQVCTPWTILRFIRLFCHRLSVTSFSR